MNILVTTIPHSGTHVLRYQILRAHFEDGDECLFNGDSKNKMVKCHTDQLFRFSKEFENYPIFTSLRHPRRIAKSFEERHEKFGNRLNNYTWDNFHNHFRILIDLVDKKSPFYLHVDNDVRDKEVEVMREFLDLPIESNWEVCKRSGAVCGNHDIDIDQCPEVPQEYIDFYYETIERMKC